MDAIRSTPIITRRLDRLRAAPRRVAPSRDRPDHASDLAEVLGGTAASRAPGIVDCRREFVIPIDRPSLAALPFGVPVDAPLVCLDLETTGLATAAGTLAFIVGLGTWRDETLTVRQLVLPDHSDEEQLLDALSDSLPRGAWLVTYNGRGFDWPLVVARYRLHRRAPPELAGHLDLLPIARRLWKHRLGGARLVTVEGAICDVTRDDDLPGALAPERYFGYLRSRDGRLLAGVVDHNRQDIVSLGMLVAVLGSIGSRAAWPEMHPGDLLGLARAYARFKRLTDALECVDAALASRAWLVPLPSSGALRRHASAERARLLARLGRRAESQAAWLDIAERGGPGAGSAWLHVARYREHVERDIAGALAACHSAAAIAGRARAWGSPLNAVENDLERRLPRLARRKFGDRFARRPAPEVSRAA